MNSNFNRQFLMLDFALLDDAEFLRFTRKAAFAAYLLLRRYVWRSHKPHALGLHEMYWNQRRLASSISVPRLAEKLRIKDRSKVSKYLTFLEEQGVIKSLRTGRENIFLLGEWVDYSELQDGSRRLEWFYLDRKFGVETAEYSDVAEMDTSDVAKTDTSDVQKPGRADVAKPATSDIAKTDTSDVAMWPKRPSQMWPKQPDINREENKEQNVNVDQGKSPLNHLPETGIETDHADLIVDDLVGQLGDRESARFYRLVARKVPEPVIRQALAEVRQADGIHNSAALFNHKLRQYAEHRLQESTKSRIDAAKQDIG